MAREMKDSGIKWIGNIPSDWRLYRLKWILNERKEKNDPQQTDFILSLGAAYGVIPYSEKEGGGNKAKEDLTDYRLAYPNDIVMNSMNIISGSVGLSKYFGCVSPVYYMLYPREKSYSSKYYCFLFQTAAFQRSLLGLGNGILMKESSTGNFNTVRMRIPMEKLGVQFLPLPTADEQHRIADYLDKECSRIDSVIEQTRASIEEYKKLKQAVITRAVTKGIRQNREMKDSGVEWIGEIPAGWQILSLGTVTESMRNGYVGPTKDLFFDNGIRYIQSLHIKDGKIDFARHEYYVSEEWAKTHPKIKKNDVLIVQTGEIGNVGLVTAEYDGCNCHALIIATPRTDLIVPEYLTYYLRSVVGRELLLYYKTGALLPHLNSGKIKFANVCVPSIQEQIEITNYLDMEVSRIDELMAKKETVVNELESYKKSLIFEYVTGKKEVPA